jgi:hypothetical protein
LKINKKKVKFYLGCTIAIVIVVTVYLFLYFSGIMRDTSP